MIQKPFKIFYIVFSVLLAISMVVGLAPSLMVEASDTPPDLAAYVLSNSWGAETNVFNGPGDVAVSPDGRIYILNSGLSRVTIVTPGEEVFHNFGSFGFGAGQLINTTSIAIDEGGNVYVLGLFNINKFTADGDFIANWGNFSFATGIAIQGDFVYIIDQFANCIHKFSLEGIEELDSPWCGVCGSLGQ